MSEGAQGQTSVTGQDLSTWRQNRESGWHLDVGYRIQDELVRHHYDTHNKGSKTDDPGWHVCTCGEWEGYWSGFEPHVADRLRFVVTGSSDN